MKVSDCRLDMQVVVSDEEDTTVYTVRELSGFVATLVYPAKFPDDGIRFVNGGTMDVCFLTPATPLQIANFEQTLK